MTLSKSSDFISLIDRVAPKKPDALCLGTVTTVGASVYVTFDEDAGIETQSVLPVVGSYKPLLNDRVVLARINNAWTIIGPVQATSPTWQPIPLASGMSAYSTAWPVPAYIEIGGNVQLRGLVKKSSAWVSGDVIGTMPAGFRPATDGTPGGLHFSAVMSTGSGGVAVMNSGVINVPVLVGSPTWISLDGITYLAEQ